MRREDFTEPETGALIEIMYDQWAFVPAPLPPRIDLTWEIVAQLSKADCAVSELEGIARTIPNPHLFTGTFTRQEAVLSSRIEGTQTTLTELVLFEEFQEDSQKTEKERTDVREVVNYLNALNFGLAQVQERPVSLMMIREMHEILMHEVRGQDKSPGQFRTGQNHIGPPGSRISAATYVPPPPLQMNDALYAFEKYLNTTLSLPLFIRMALIHYQFEAIHPFEDGNGRIGRLLMMLMLCKEKRLSQPFLYLSGYFERHRSTYTDLLLRVSQKAEWNLWLEFFLNGITEQSMDVVKRIDGLHGLRDKYKQKLQDIHAPGLAYEIIDDLFSFPVLSISRTCERRSRSFNTVKATVEKLQSAEILQEFTKRERNRMYVAQEIIKMIEM